MKTYTAGRGAGALVRAIGVLGLVAALVTGVTFAALSSQNNIISGNRLTSASANLQMSKLSDTGFSSALTGYNFYDVAPGGPPAPQTGNDLYLRNFGSTDLDLRVSLNPGRLQNINGVNLQNVYLVIMDYDGINQLDKFSLAQLSAAYTVGTPLPINIVLGKNMMANFKLRMQLDDTAVSQQDQIDIENMDFIFSGVAV